MRTARPLAVFFQAIFSLAVFGCSDYHRDVIRSSRWSKRVSLVLSKVSSQQIITAERSTSLKGSDGKQREAPPVQRQRATGPAAGRVRRQGEQRGHGGRRGVRGQAQEQAQVHRRKEELHWGKEALLRGEQPAEREEPVHCLRGAGAACGDVQDRDQDVLRERTCGWCRTRSCGMVDAHLKCVGLLGGLLSDRKSPRRTAGRWI